MEWQKIETAPTELKHPSYLEGPVIIGFAEWGNGSKHVGPAIYQYGSWEFVCLDDFDMFPGPTHWMPLPKAPE